MNNVAAAILLVLLSWSCNRRTETSYRTALRASSPAVITGDTLLISPSLSTIHWIATEMRGTVQRTGNIRFQDGFLLLSDQKLVGGKLIVDMKTMDVTDMPAHETVARRNLINHLMDDDFFAVHSFPLSVLEIGNVQKAAGNGLNVTADLTIRGITRQISFDVSRTVNGFETMIEINRLEWNVAYQGSLLDKTLIDPMITLQVRIVLRKH